MTASVFIKPDGPFDLPLSLMAAASFLPPLPLIPRSLRLAIRISERPAVIEIGQRSRAPPVIAASATPPVPGRQLHELARWLTACDLDLRAFYRIVARDPIMGPLAKRLRDRADVVRIVDRNVLIDGGASQRHEKSEMTVDGRRA